ncbi:MAG: DUF4836 family protein, partial [Chitinophagaceae bacterium]
KTNMKLTLRPYLLLVILLVLLGSCSKKANVPVPADAAVVIHFNGSSLNSKLSWDEFKQGELYKLAYEEVKDDLARKILDNPDSSGVDIKSDAFFFLRARANGSGYASFTCLLKDEKAFTNAMSKLHERSEVTKAGNLSLIKLGNDGVLTWDSKRFVFIGYIASMNPAAPGFKYNEGNVSSDTLLKFANEVYDIKGSSSIASNAKFASMMKEDGDAHFWLNPGSLYSGSLGSVLMMLPKAGALFQGNFTASTLNFANGKITVDAKSYVNKELSELYKKYSMKNLDADVLKKIPAGEIDAAFAMNYPPEGLKAFLSLLGVDGLVNVYLAELGYSIDDFIKANKGDIVVSVSDFAITEKEKKYDMGAGIDPQVYKSKSPEAKILFATSVNDKASFDKLMGLLQSKVIAEGGPMVQSVADKIPYQLKDNWFVAGSDSAHIHSFGNTSTNHSFISKISGHPMGGFIDIQKFITGARPSMGDSTALLVSDESLKFWQDVVFYGGGGGSDAMESHLEVNLVDQTGNSLKQLHSYLGRIAKLFKDAEDKRKAEWENSDMKAQADSVMVAPPATGK